MHYKAYKGDAGIDLYITKVCKKVVLSNEAKLYTLDTDTTFDISKGTCGLVLPRSSASSEGIIVLTGVIDSGYKGTIKINAIIPNDVTVGVGSSIAQIVFVKYEEIGNIEYKLDYERGIKGFGSSNEVNNG